MRRIAVGQQRILGLLQLWNCRKAGGLLDEQHRADDRAEVVGGANISYPSLFPQAENHRSPGTGTCHPLTGTAAILAAAH